MAALDASTGVKGRSSPSRNVSSICNIVDHPIITDVVLFREAISQAVIDAISNNPRLVRERYDAVKWLLYDKKDFFDVCDFAQLDHQYIRDKARKFLNE